MIEATDLAWAAGFFSGEGSTLMKRFGSGTRNLVLSATQTNEEEVLRLQRILGGKVYGPYKRGKPHYKPQWVWNVYGKEGVMLALNKMWDWLSSAKREQALRALEGMR